MKTTLNKNLLILSFTLVVVMLGFGMVIPVYPFFITRLGASGSELGLLVAIAALTEFLFGPLWGSVSDQVGRKPVLMVGILGYGLSMLLFGVATEMWMLYLSRALSGVLSSATMAAAMAYIGDSTTGKSRGGGMGLIGASAGVGTIIGPGIGGLLAGQSLATPFFFAAGLSLVSLALIALLLPESLSRPAAANPNAAPQTGSVRPKLQLIRLKELGQAVAPSSPIRLLLLLAFLATFGTSNFESVFGLYMLKKLEYGPEQVGAILTIMGIIALLGRGLLTGPVTRRWGEPVVIRASLLVGALGFVLLLLANRYATVMLSTGVFVFSTTFLRPSIHSLTSQRTQVGQGSAMGMSNAFVSLGRVVGPIFAGLIFDLNPSLPYLSGAVILLVIVSVTWKWLEC